MKLQQLIAAGFAITALAAATVPAVGWTLGSVETPPPAPMHTSWDLSSHFLAESEQPALRPVRYDAEAQGANPITW